MLKLSKHMRPMSERLRSSERQCTVHFATLLRGNSTYRLAGLDKLTIPRLSLETASNPKASFLMCRGGRSADTSLATDILSVKAVPVDFGTFTPIQDGKQPNAGKCESHRE
jgi:hypothetical protein